jgi:4-hydroxy-tetrahydrodipicolinate synthase
MEGNREFMSTSTQSKIVVQLEGISGIPITPFTREGNIDTTELQKVVMRITDADVELIVACGNTAEYSSLTQDEIREVTAVTVDAAGDATTLVGVGGDVRSARGVVQHAVDVGAAGFMIHAPSHAYVSDAGLLDYYRMLAEATELPVVIYLRGREPSDSVMELVVSMDNVVAIKYANRDLMGFARLVERYGEHIVPVCGLAESWAPFFWLAGGRGFTSGLVNVAPRLSVRLLNALTAGDYSTARRLWLRIKPFEQLRERNGNALNVPAVKAAMQLRGYLQNADVRPPLSGLTADESNELALCMSAWEAVDE